MDEYRICSREFEGIKQYKAQVKIRRNTFNFKFLKPKFKWFDIGTSWSRDGLYCSRSCRRWLDSKEEAEALIVKRQAELKSEEKERRIKDGLNNAKIKCEGDY